jgi:hypothetical protein
MQKFATAEIIGKPSYASATSGLVRTSHRAVFTYEPREGYLYVRSRMISSRCNDNYDEFPADEIKRGYLSFVGKPVFVNHHNDNHRRMRGVIIDAVLHEDHNPDGSADTWVEGLMEVDAVRFPKLAAALIKGDIQRTSMGVDVKYSICSACGNKASTPAEYCPHIPRQKGTKIWRVEASTGRRKGELIREICHGLGFFENSLLVEEPADPTAFFLGKVEVGPGLEHLTATATLQVPLPSGSHAPTQRPLSLGRTASRSTSPIVPTGGLMLVQGSLCIACAGLNTVADRATGITECVDCEQVWNPRLAMQVEAKPKYENPGDHPFFQDNPVHHDNVLAHWNAATPDEKASGMRWYPDAHVVAKALGEKYLPDHPHGPAHAAAGVIANYSAQTPWAANQHNAARALHGGKGIGGPGSGIFASLPQKKAADDIMGGQNYNDVLGGHKIKDFAHLIEHGGDKDEDDPHVVIDRHALSVATGKRMTNDDYTKFPKTQRHYYDHVVNAYKKAADHVTEKTGQPVSGHQMQAATWLVRQRFNEAAEDEHAKAGNDSRLNRGRAKSRDNGEAAWEGWKGEHMPEMGQGPGTGYSKPKKEGGRSLRGTRFPRG